MKKIKTIADLNVSGKRVLVRVDYNVPMAGGTITDTTRLKRTLPTLRELTSKGAKVIILSHLGRPKGKVVESLSLRPVAEALSTLLGQPVAFAEDCLGEEAHEAIDSMKEGDIVLLENVRFYPGEELNASGFAGRLAAHADAYVGEAFSCAHRAHATVDAIARLLPSAAGRLMLEEIKALDSALENPERPVAAIIGGAKISSKLAVLGNLISKVNLLVIGGGMANTFLHAQGFNVGASLCEHDLADSARAILEKAEAAGCEILLPLDAVVATELRSGVETKTVLVNSIPEDSMILDVGPETVSSLIARVKRCKTLVWNGPLGAFEVPPFNAATNTVAMAMARMTMDGHLISVVGGGDTVAALAHSGIISSYTYVSTAGGAFLEWLEGKELPGVAVLRD